MASEMEDMKYLCPSSTTIQNTGACIRRSLEPTVQRRIEDAIQETADPNLPVRESQPNLSDEAKLALLKKRAVAALTNSLTSVSVIGLIDDSKTDEFRNGRAWWVMRELNKRSAPQGIMAEFDVEDAWKMKLTDNPLTLFDQIMATKDTARMAHVPLSELMLKRHIMKAAPMEYQNLLSRCLEEDSVSTQTIAGRMTAYFSQIKEKVEEKLKRQLRVG